MATRRLRSVCATGLLALIACEPGDADAPAPYSCYDAFPDWPCARNMCRACQEAGGELRMTLSEPASLACSDEREGPPVLEEDFCRRPYCMESVEPVDEATAAEFVGLVAGEHMVPLVWFPEDTRGLESVVPAPGTATDLTIVAQPIGEVELVRSELVVPETEGVADFNPDYFGCQGGLAVDATIALTTSDGRLEETFDVRLSDTDSQDATPDAWGRVTLDLPSGVTVVPEDMYTVEEIRAGISFGPEGASGGIRLDLFFANDIGASPSSVVVADW